MAMAEMICAPAFAQGRADATHVLCGYPPGGSVDAVSRKAAEKLAKRSVTPAWVDNRPGAAGRLAVMELLKGRADGRTLLVTPASVLTMYPHVYGQLGYDPLRDLAPVCTLAATAFALAVGPAVPPEIRQLPAFLEWCRQDGRHAQCGNAGAGSMPHFMAMLLARATGVEFQHVPFRGGSAAMQAVAAGELASALATEAAARPLVEAGRLRVLTVSSATRSPFFTGAPTFQEFGYAALTQREWFGVFAPSAVARGTIDLISEALREGFADPDARDLLRGNALLPDSLGPDPLLAALQTETGFWGNLIRSSGFRADS